MFNDKFIIEASCNYVYRLAELNNEESTLSKYIKEHYPNYKIVEINSSYKDSNLGLVCFQDITSKDIAVIFQGSTNLNDWRYDNLYIFLGKNGNQYEQALNYVNNLVSEGYRVTHLGGNSLGGGAAQYVALKYPHIRALCINASPLNEKVNLISYDNIIHIRNSADLLYRSVMLDEKRYDYGYVGQIKVINRSLYGDADYYKAVELAHRGSIIFPYSYIYKHYRVDNLKDLKTKITKTEYTRIMQLFEAPSLAKYMSFDLVTNNLDDLGVFDLDELQHNFSIRIKEINQSLSKYHLTNLNLCIGLPLIQINDEINDKLKEILKHSLLQITKKEEKLYDNIYFIIEKSTDYFYKLITTSLYEVQEKLNGDLLAADYQTIVNNLTIQKQLIDDLVDNLILINNELYDLNQFSFKELINKPTIKYFNQYATPFKYDYKTLLYDKIDDSIKTNIANNKAFVKQINGMVSATLKASQITLSILSISNKNDLKPSDLDHLLTLNIKELLNRSMDIFKEDIYSTLLQNSLLYNFQSTLRCFNEQLEQLKMNHENLLEYLSADKANTKQKRLEKLIKDNLEYINKFIEYNYTYVNF